MGEKDMLIVFYKVFEDRVSAVHGYNKPRYHHNAYLLGQRPPHYPVPSLLGTVDITPRAVWLNVHQVNGVMGMSYGYPRSEP